MVNKELNNFDVKEWYLSNYELFETGFNGNKELPFNNIRKKAISKFSDLGFPTPRNEDWKYTNVAPILKHKFQLPTNSDKLPDNISRKFAYEGLEQNVLVFLNGQFSKELSTYRNKNNGLIVDSLQNALHNCPELIDKYLGSIADYENETFTALNTAFINDGAFIYVSKGAIEEEPIHILNLSVSKDSEFIAHHRNLIVAEKESEIQIVESFHHLTNNTYFNNIVSEIVVGENAKIDYIKIQDESEHAFHISTTQINQEYSSVFTSVNIDLGGELVRNNLNFSLNAQNCESNMFGFFLGGGTQHIDNHTFIDHAKPHCYSNQLYKGILDEKANAVFNGKILVRPDAQKTNALQSNKTLLLTNEASINAKPQLEIFADDVKCTHGATIGQLDDEAVFYLRARGIGEEVAGAMLRYAFAADVFKNIKVAPVREKLNVEILERLSKVEGKE